MAPEEEEEESKKNVYKCDKDEIGILESPCYLHTYDTLTKQLRGIAEVILGWDHLDTSLALQGCHERQDRQD